MENLGLQEIKGQLDEIDQQLVKLIEQRVKLYGDIAEFKVGTGKPVYDGEREKQRLQSVTNMVRGDFSRQSMYELFIQLMTISHKYQCGLSARHEPGLDTGFTMMDELKREGVRIVYQGVGGAYSHRAAIQFFDEDAGMYHVAIFEDAMVKVEEGRAGYTIFPIENSLAGTVSDDYDNLIRHNLYIMGETEVSVTHALLGLKEVRLSNVKRVYSRPQELMQCSSCLSANRQWTQFSMEDTAETAKKVLEDQDISQTAMVNGTTGRIYGLQILKRTINHDKDNTIRSIVLSRHPVYRKDAGKISVCFEGLHKSGSLYNILGNFTYSGVNILMIGFRPIVGRSWEYQFFMDVEGCLSDAPIQNALRGISEEAAGMRILGNC